MGMGSGKLGPISKESLAMMKAMGETRHPLNVQDVRVCPSFKYIMAKVKQKRIAKIAQKT